MTTVIYREAVKVMRNRRCIGTSDTGDILRTVTEVYLLGDLASGTVAIISHEEEGITGEDYPETYNIAYYGDLRNAYTDPGLSEIDWVEDEDVDDYLSTLGR